MAAYNLHISQEALQELQDLDRNVCQRLIKKIRWLAAKPLSKNNLTGEILETA
jgi:mRNA-degrading endonuclease RelE of RelBE toxin-antitoxin system